MRESSTRSVGSRYDWPNEIRLRYCRHVYLHLHLAHNVKDCTLDWIFDTHSPQLKHSHSGKSICDLIVFYCRNVFFPDGNGFECFPMFSISSAQRFPVRSAQQSVCGSPFVPVPPCHAMSCPLFPQNGDSEKHLSLPASRWGLGQSQRFDGFSKVETQLRPKRWVLLWSRFHMR